MIHRQTGLLKVFFFTSDAAPLVGYFLAAFWLKRRHVLPDPSLTLASWG